MLLLQAKSIEFFKYWCYYYKQKAVSFKNAGVIITSKEQLVFNIVVLLLQAKSS